MSYHFDEIIDRHNTGSTKWDFMPRAAGQSLLPMGVSDYDFACSQEVIEALHHRIEHPIFGYSQRDAGYFQAVIDWFSQRHRLSLDAEWICTIEGVVPGLALLLQMMSKPGDGIVVQGPYYGSFNKIISLNGRRLLENPLMENSQQGYIMDYQHLEMLFARERPPVMLLCNPHNPTGRCWSEEELYRLLTLCERYDVQLISDEIWADLLLPGHRFTSVLHLGARWYERVITATSASKTFGLSSMRISNFLIPDAVKRQQFIQRLDAHGLDVFNTLSMTAATTAYRSAAAWLDALLDYLAANRTWFYQQVTEHLPWARVAPAQGTYLLWLDCRGLNISDEALQLAMAECAGIAPSMGLGFGEQGSGFVRLNLGCPREYLEKAIEGLRKIAI